MTKICTKCGEEKDINEFGPKKTSPDRHTTRCRKCLAEDKREYLSRPNNEKEVPPEGTHKCSKCGEIKALEKFHKRVTCKDGYSQVCLCCSNKYNDTWKLENREQHLQSRKDWYNANIETEHARMLAYHKRNYKRLHAKYREWVANHRDHHNNTQREYFRDLANTDPHYRLIKRCRSRIAFALKNGHKATHTSELLGVSVEDFRRYIAAQFVDGMTWEAFMVGKVELDHIRPISSFNFDNPIEQYICFNYRNHQPLWKNDNRSKSDRWSTGSQLLWKNTIEKEVLYDLISCGIIDSSYEGC
jgi:hypothetical protein